MGKDRPALPKSELEVLRIVWQLKQATVRQVVDALPAERELDFFTVQTYLRRLEAKGYLSKRREGRTNVYAAAVRPTRVVSEVLDDFVDRLFDGEAVPLMQHLIQDRGLSTDEMDRLQEMLNELRSQSAAKPQSKSQSKPVPPSKSQPKPKSKRSTKENDR